MLKLGLIGLAEMHVYLFGGGVSVSMSIYICTCTNLLHNMYFIIKSERETINYLLVLSKLNSFNVLCLVNKVYLIY